MFTVKHRLYMLFDSEYEKRYGALIEDLRIANRVWLEQSVKNNFKVIISLFSMGSITYVTTKSLLLTLIAPITYWILLYLIYISWAFISKYRELELYKWK